MFHLIRAAYTCFIKHILQDWANGDCEKSFESSKMCGKGYKLALRL